MSRRRSRHQTERRQKAWRAVAKLALFLGVVGTSGYYAYEVGQRLSAETITDQRADIVRLSQTVDEQAERIGTLEQSLLAKTEEAESFRLRYEAVAPSDEMKEILHLVAGKLTSGIQPQRLAFVIEAAERPRNCQEATTKRFMVKTPTFTGPPQATWVRFEDIFTVAAEGVGEADANGYAQQWFDPAGEVTVHFTALGGKDSVVSGTLPLHHNMVHRNKEYRFTVTPGARGFVEVTADRCDFKG